MSKKIIKTIKGEDLPISACRKYDKSYYKIGDINVENSGDCYKIDDKFYRFETGQVVFNHSIKQYCLKSSYLKYGLIENNQKGYFNSSNDNISIIDENGHDSFAINEKILKENLNYREEISSGNYMHISLIPARAFSKIKVPNKEYKHSLPYDSNGLTDGYLSAYNALYDSKLSLSIVDFSTVIEDLTFGLEFETIAGFLPKRITNRLGLIPLRDGSIDGLEYVTVPLKGAKGLQTIVDITSELKERTKFDYKCALHLHIGNIPRTKEFILAFFKLSLYLQDEIFALFPIYKKYNMGIKNKNYSKPYSTYDIVSKMDPVITSDNLDKNFAVLFDYLSECGNGAFYHKFNNDLKNVTSHPKDSSGHQKWNIKTRYYFHNFIPLIFGNKQTIEFRIHTPTYDIEKILMFLGINSILINYTLENTSSILQNSNFLNSELDGRKLLDIINKHLTSKGKKGKFKKNNIIGVSTLYESFKYYIQKRKNIIENKTANGEILINEDDVQLRTYINFKDERVIDSDFNSKIKLNDEIIDLTFETPVLKKDINMVAEMLSDDNIKDFKEKLYGKGISQQVREGKTSYYSDIYDLDQAFLNSFLAKEKSEPKSVNSVEKTTTDDKQKLPW